MKSKHIPLVEAVNERIKGVSRYGGRFLLEHEYITSHYVMSDGSGLFKIFENGVDLKSVIESGYSLLKGQEFFNATSQEDTRFGIKWTKKTATDYGIKKLVSKEEEFRLIKPYSTMNLIEMHQTPYSKAISKEWEDKGLLHSLFSHNQKMLNKYLSVICGATKFALDWNIADTKGIYQVILPGEYRDLILKHFKLVRLDSLKESSHNVL